VYATGYLLDQTPHEINQSIASPDRFGPLAAGPSLITNSA
jgi:hypothetical protein